MNKFIVVFCEGDHDIAFLSRLLYVDGFKPYEKKVKEFDKPLNNLYIQNLQQKKIEDSEFKFQRPNKKVPYVVLYKEDKLILFHNLDGDGNILNRNSSKIVKMYLDLNRENLRRIAKYNKLNYRFLYFLDSDNEGESQRVEELKAFFEIDELEVNRIIQKDNFEIGCHIFCDIKHHNRNGKLEDILLSLMHQDNEDIFDNSKDFIQDRELPVDRQRRFISNAQEENYTNSIQFKKEKSIISIAGQLQFSGASNAVIIANSDYIRKDDILTNQTCINIIRLFN